MQLEISVQVGQVHWIGVWKGVPRYWKRVGPESLVHSEHLGKEKEKRSERERAWDSESRYVIVGILTDRELKRLGVVAQEGGKTMTLYSEKKGCRERRAVS